MNNLLTQLYNTLKSQVHILVPCITFSYVSQPSLGAQIPEEFPSDLICYFDKNTELIAIWNPKNERKIDRHALRNKSRFYLNWARSSEPVFKNEEERFSTPISPIINKATYEFIISYKNNYKENYEIDFESLNLRFLQIYNIPHTETQIYEGVGFCEETSR